MIALSRQIVPLASGLRDGQWRQPVGRQISSAVVGIIGCGHVGKEVARLCRAFGATVIAHDIRAYDDFYRAHDVTPVDLATLLERSDIVTVHVPLDASTRGMIGAREIARMQRTACLINTARGGIVDEAALKRALTSGQLAGAAFDVFAAEPPIDDELLRIPNFLATPHIGASTDEAALAMGRAAIRALDGSPESIDLTAEIASPKI
jgi:D-3-phosphoglycerate dehydrogenase